MVSYYLGPTEHEYTKKKFFSPRLKFRKNSVYHASDEAMGSFICKYYHGTNEMCMIASITNVTSMAIDTYRSANLRLGPDNFKDFPPKRRTIIFQ